MWNGITAEPDRWNGIEWNNACAAKGGMKRNGMRVARRQLFHLIPSYSTYFLDIKITVGLEPESLFYLAGRRLKGALKH